MFGLNILAIIISTILLNSGLLVDVVQEFFVEPFYEDRKLAQEIRATIPSITWKRFSDINGLSFDMPADWTIKERTREQKEHNYVLFLDAGKYGSVLEVISPIIYNGDYWGSVSFSHYDLSHNFEKIRINGKEFYRCKDCLQQNPYIFVYFGKDRIFEFHFLLGHNLMRQSRRAIYEIVEKTMQSVVIEE